MSNTENVRCRKCRHVLLSGEEIILRNAHNKLVSEVYESDEACASVQDKNCFYISDEELPQFILDAVTEASWTKGKIHCPGCQARLGSFNFVSYIKCSCNSISLPAVHLLASKVDWLRANCLMQHAISVPNQVPTSQENKSLLAREDLSVLRETDLTLVAHTASTTGVSTTCSDTNREITNQNEATGPCDFVEFSEDNSGWYEFLTQELSLDYDDEEDYTDIPIPSGSQGRKIRRELKKQQRKNKNKVKVEKRLQEKTEREKEKKFKKEAEEEESSRIPGHLTCPICLELLHNPCRTQPCKHVFCEPCLRRLGGECTPCPLCRELIGQCIPDRDIGREIRENFPVLYSTRQEFERKMTKFERPLPYTSDHRLNQARRRWNLDIQNWDLRNLVIQSYLELPWLQKLLIWGLALKFIYYLAIRIHRAFFMIDFADIEELLEKDISVSRIRRFPSYFYKWD